MLGGQKELVRGIYKRKRPTFKRSSGATAVRLLYSDVKMSKRGVVRWEIIIDVVK